MRAGGGGGHWNGLDPKARGLEECKRAFVVTGGGGGVGGGAGGHGTNGVRMEWESLADDLSLEDWRDELHVADMEQVSLPSLPFLPASLPSSSLPPSLPPDTPFSHPPPFSLYPKAQMQHGTCV